MRQIKRLLKALKKRGDRAVIHGLRRRPAPRRLPEGKKEERSGSCLSRCTRGSDRRSPPNTEQQAWANGEQRAAAALDYERQAVARRKRKPERVHVRRPRRTRCGALVQWDTPDHDWLEGRGERVYLISMIDNATSRLNARFVTSDSTARRRWRVLAGYLKQQGRPLAFYTDKAALFQTAQKHSRDEPGVENDPADLPAYPDLLR
jgi:hypothetical protein